MKRVDKTFDELYNSIEYGGSFYKGTKIGEPDEYDLDLVISFPENFFQVHISFNIII